MKKNEPKLISASTILILSGFLIGLTVGKVVSESLSPYVLSCGLAGFLAFIALEFAGTQREEQSAHEEQVHVQGRLDRHILSQSSISFILPPSSTDGHEKSVMHQSSSDLRKLDALYDELMRVQDTSGSVVLGPNQSVQA